MKRRHSAFRRRTFDERGLQRTLRGVHRSRGELVDEPLGGGLSLDLGEQLHGGNIPVRSSHVVGHPNDFVSSLRMSPDEGQVTDWGIRLPGHRGPREAGGNRGDGSLGQWQTTMVIEPKDLTPLLRWGAVLGWLALAVRLLR